VLDQEKLGTAPQWQSVDQVVGVFETVAERGSLLRWSSLPLPANQKHTQRKYRSGLLQSFDFLSMPAKTRSQPTHANQSSS